MTDVDVANAVEEAGDALYQDEKHPDSDFSIELLDSITTKLQQDASFRFYFKLITFG